VVAHRRAMVGDRRPGRRCPLRCRAASGPRRVR
jgi:hypothetical protein